MKSVLTLCVFLFALAAGTASRADDPKALPDLTKQVTGAPTNEQLARQVRKRSVKEDIRTSIRAMEALLKQWNPVGKTPDDLVAMIGHPDEKDLEQLIYRFDNGLGGGSEWVFVIQSGRIVSVDHRGLE